MKILVLILGSTTLVAGGTAITSQQDVRNNMTAHRPHQEHRAASRGTDCPPVETPIFDSVPYPLVLGNSCANIWSRMDMDVDGDGNNETSLAEYYNDCSQGWEYNIPATKMKYVEGSNPPAIIAEAFLDVSPEMMQYDGVTGHIEGVWLRGYLDVTNDGKPDAILLVRGNEKCLTTPDGTVDYLFYVENISEWPAACASDLNNDGAVEVNDLMQIISNWGECE
jgi:hypothetical protein